jgi:hypothetical protein
VFSEVTAGILDRELLWRPVTSGSSQTTLIGYSICLDVQGVARDENNCILLAVGTQYLNLDTDGFVVYSLTAGQWGNGKTVYSAGNSYTLRLAGVNGYNKKGTELEAIVSTSTSRRMLGASNSSSVRELSMVRLPLASCVD